MTTGSDRAGLVGFSRRRSRRFTGEGFHCVTDHFAYNAPIAEQGFRVCACFCRTVVVVVEDARQIKCPRDAREPRRPSEEEARAHPAVIMRPWPGWVNLACQALAEQEYEGAKIPTP